MNTAAKIRTVEDAIFGASSLFSEFIRFFDAEDIRRSYGLDCNFGIEAALSFDVGIDNMCRVHVRIENGGEQVQIELTHVEGGRRQVGTFSRELVGPMLGATSDAAGDLSGGQA